MTPSIRILLPVICAILWAVPQNGYPWGLQAGGGYLFDNTVFDRQTYSLSVTRISVPSGDLAAQAAFEGSRMRDPFGGLSAFDDAFLSLGAAYSVQGAPGFVKVKLNGGRSVGSDGTRFFVSGEVPVRLALPHPGTRLLATAGGRYGVADDNPATARMGVNKRTAFLDAGLGLRFWEVHCSYRYDWYAPVHRDQYRRLLSDTLFFQAFYDIFNPAYKLIDARTDPIAANEVHQASAFIFGPAAPFLYVGGSFTYRDAARDTYIPLADTDSGDVVYAYFPYKTPHREGSVGIIAELVHHSDPVSDLLNDASLKVDFPAYSFGSYRGYYQPPSGNLLAGFKDFYYDYHGTGVLTVEAKAGKHLPGSLGIYASYVWVSKPYVAYHFIGSDSYQYHTVTVHIKKDF